MLAWHTSCTSARFRSPRSGKASESCSALVPSIGKPRSLSTASPPAYIVAGADKLFLQTAFPHDDASPRFDKFAFDVTNLLLPGAQQQLLQVAVYDPTEFGHIALGKQRLHPPRHPSSIWYTSNTGIWQTVWLEPVRSRVCVHNTGKQSSNRFLLHTSHVLTSSPTLMPAACT